MVVDFTDMRNEVRKGIQELIKYHSCVAWLDYGDDGNPCYDPYVFDTRIEREVDALTHAAVKVELAKNSSTHHLLAELVAKDVKNEYVTYDWLIKIVARILCGTSVEQLHDMLELSNTVRKGMKEKGLTQISSIEAALA